MGQLDPVCEPLRLAGRDLRCRGRRGAGHTNVCFSVLFFQLAVWEGRGGLLCNCCSVVLAMEEQNSTPWPQLYSACPGSSVNLLSDLCMLACLRCPLILQTAVAAADILRDGACRALLPGTSSPSCQASKFSTWSRTHCQGHWVLPSQPTSPNWMSRQMSSAERCLPACQLGCRTLRLPATGSVAAFLTPGATALR